MKSDEPNYINYLPYGLIASVILFPIGYFADIQFFQRVAVVTATGCGLALIIRAMKLESKAKHKRNNPGSWNIISAARLLWITFIGLCVLWGFFEDFIWAVPTLACFGLGIAVIVKAATPNRTTDNYSESAPYGTEHGSASWASEDQIFKSANNAEKGLYIGGDLLRKEIGHLLTVAGTRQGKGTCLIIPSLLVDPIGSYVITDPKGEISFITARAQKEAGYQATHAMAASLEKEAMQVASFEQFYKGYKDLNEFWMNKPNLT